MTREFLNETQERFLKGIVAQLPIERIAEVHLFHPMRQGGTESGVAVIAAWPEKLPVVAEELPADAGAGAELGVIEEEPIEAEPLEESPVEPHAEDATNEAQESGDDAAELEELEQAGAGAELGVTDDASEPVDAEGEMPAEEIVDEEQAPESGELRARGGDSSATAVGASEREVGGDDETSDDDDEAGAAEPDDDADEGPAVEEPEARKETPRFTVYTAHYRLVLKGPDRGKWELGVTAEADAPLLTVETVVRGVQQRAGDVEPPNRYDGTELRALLRIPDEQPQAPATR